MNWTRSATVSILIIGIPWLFDAKAEGEKVNWQSMPGGRWAALEIPANGKTGFTILAPQQTGITFTNSIDEWQSASNRVLFNGSGVAVGDYDNDGRPDIFFCSLNGRNTLYKNLGGWRFSDVTLEAGLKRDQRFYRGAVFADVNGDSWLDLLVCVLGGGVECFINDGKGHFIETTEMARTRSSFGSSTLALADVDGNGTMDLYVANNRTEDIRDRGQLDLPSQNGQPIIPPALQDRLVFMNGQLLEYGEPDQLYLNDGKGHFTPVSWTGGRFRNEEGGPLTRAPLDWGLTATFRDINGDGFPDLYVCNDFWTPDRIWLNDGKGRFRAAPRLALRCTSASSMGIDFADVDGDGLLDFFVVDMLSRELRLRKRQKPAQPPMPSPIGVIDDRPQIMRNTFFVNRGDGTFAELANYSGLAASEWSWSPVFLDVDLDGLEDLIITTGHAKDVQDLDAQKEINARQHSWKRFGNEADRQKAFTRELMEHMRLYPPLDTPIIAFRNQGGFQFKEVTPEWGTDQRGVHHALAFADLDGDGDLDLVVNNLGSGAGIYRNETTAPRVAVRLRGLPPNTQAIGAKVKLLEGAVPVQSREVVSGGHYMSGSDPLPVFAAGAASNDMTLEVNWRSGRHSRITGIRANRLYEIDEARADASVQSNAPNNQAAAPAAAGSNAPRLPRRSNAEEGATPRAPLFEDVSHLLQHTHHEEPFDDFERQPLLRRRLSQLGPGTSWFDVDGDGREDLLVASGKGGQMACYRNNGQGGFERLHQVPLDTIVTRDQTTILGWRGSNGLCRLLAGSANYEDGLAAGPAARIYDLSHNQINDSLPGAIDSTGPLALADIAGEGGLVLFVGGRVLPGHYPEASSSRLYRFDGAKFQIDSKHSKLLENIGLVSGAVWSDLDGDGFPELILACDCGPLKIFRNNHGELQPWDAALSYPERQAGKGGGGEMRLSQLTGFWNGVTTGDLDGDGRLDIVASNWGLNSDYHPTPEHPIEIYYGDLLERGMADLIEAEWDPYLTAFSPRLRLDQLGRHLPVLFGRLASHRAYSEASISDVLGPEGRRARKIQVTTLASMVFFNRGDHFQAVPLPFEAQLAPAFAVNVADFDGDGSEDVFISQNFFATAPDVPRLDAGRGLLLKGDGEGGLKAVSGQSSGIAVYGEQRGAAVADYDGDGRPDLVVTQNGAATRLFHNALAKPGLRVRLAGTPQNPQGIGTAMRLRFGSHMGPIREIHAGSGYWSQDGAVQVLGQPEIPTHIWVRWPGGRTNTIPIQPGASEMTVTNTAH